jgi:hypothetical protein
MKREKVWKPGKERYCHSISTRNISKYGKRPE